MTEHKIEQVPLEELKAYEGNSRTHTNDQIRQVADSIKEFGFTNPILIDDEGTIIAGHGRWAAAKKLNLEKVPCIKLGHLNEAQRRAYVIADNKLALNASWDEAKLKEEIEAIIDSDLNTGLTGFNERELDKLLHEKKEEEEPEVDFSKELLLSHNYIVLYFDNDFDWEVAKEKFQLPEVKSGVITDSCKKVGLGRVVNGKDFL